MRLSTNAVRNRYRNSERSIASTSAHLQVLHQHGHHHVDEHELRHQHEDHEVERRDEGADATVAHALLARVTILAQRVLHDAVPVIARGDAEESEEGHPEVAEVRVPAQADTGVFGGAFCGDGG